MAEEKKTITPEEEPQPVDPAPWEGYESDTADQITKKLQDLGPDSAAEVEAYEQVHGNRKSVIKAAQQASKSATFDDSEYSVEQLVRNGPSLLGHPGYVV